MTATCAYDSGIRMDKYRIMATASYCADKSMSFYGYDGYNSFYDSALDESSVVSVSLFLAWRRQRFIRVLSMPMLQSIFTSPRAVPSVLS